MTTLKVGVASYEDMKARTLRIARGERPARGAPKVWFTSTESFSKVLSGGNRALLRIIAEKVPSSLDATDTLIAPDGRRYTMLETNQTDPYDPPNPPRPRRR
jgi:predicted transcriptional regulator